MRTCHLLVALLAATGLSVAGEAMARPSEASVQRVHVHTDPALDGRGVSVQFVANVTAPAASVVQALEDIAGMPAWLPRLKSAARVEVPSVAASDAVHFDSVVGLPWPVGDVHETVAVTREQDGEVVRLRWDHVRGDMRRNEVVWTITPVDAEHAEVRYEANLWFKSWLPVFLIRIGERDYAPWFVDCLERRAAAIATAAAPPSTAAAAESAPRL